MGPIDFAQSDKYLFWSSIMKGGKIHCLWPVIDLAKWAKTGHVHHIWPEPENNPKAQPNTCQHIFYPFISSHNHNHVDASIVSYMLPIWKVLRYRETKILPFWWFYFFAFYSLTSCICGIFTVNVFHSRSCSCSCRFDDMNNGLWLEAEPMVKGEHTTDSWPKGKKSLKRSL